MMRTRGAVTHPLPWSWVFRSQGVSGRQCQYMYIAGGDLAGYWGIMRIERPGHHRAFARALSLPQEPFLPLPLANSAHPWGCQFRLQLTPFLHAPIIPHTIGISNNTNDNTSDNRLPFTKPLLGARRSIKGITYICYLSLPTSAILFF